IYSHMVTLWGNYEGISQRWAIASLLTLATCVGVVMALTIWGLRGWV
ncbi:hypothetical protein FSH19_020555, partial [Escherichia coli]|nr:hypothetical protein [Escherichia coli]